MFFSPFSFQLIGLATAFDSGPAWKLDSRSYPSVAAMNRRTNQAPNFSSEDVRVSRSTGLAIFLVNKSRPLPKPALVWQSYVSVLKVSTSASHQAPSRRPQTDALHIGIQRPLTEIDNCRLPFRRIHRSPIPTGLPAQALKTIRAELAPYMGGSVQITTISIPCNRAELARLSSSLGYRNPAATYFSCRTLTFARAAGETLVTLHGRPLFRSRALSPIRGFMNLCRIAGAYLPLEVSRLLTAMSSLPHDASKVTMSGISSTSTLQHRAQPSHS
jgi:hypothetical protein